MKSSGTEEHTRFFTRELGLLLVIELFLAMIALFLPSLHFLTVLLLPLPVALMIRRYHLRISLWSLVLVALVVYILSGKIISIVSIVLQPGIIGIVIGLMVKNHVPGRQGLMLLVISSVMVSCLVFFSVFMIQGVNPINMGREAIPSADEMMSFYTNTGLVDESTQEQLKEQMEKFVDLFSQLVPGNIIIWNIIGVYLSYLLAGRLFERMNYRFERLPSFATWQYPWQVIWGIIAGLVLLLSGDEFNIQVMNIAGKNLLYVLSFLFFVLGLSVLVYFLKNWNTRRIFKILIAVILIMYWPLGLGILLTLGVIDSVANLRRLNIEESN